MIVKAVIVKAVIEKAVIKKSLGIGWVDVIGSFVIFNVLAVHTNECATAFRLSKFGVLQIT